MKKAVSLILVMILLLCSVVSAGAESQEEVLVGIYFEELYSTVTTLEDANQVGQELECSHMFCFDSFPLDTKEYMLVKFRSTNPTNKPYFNRIGENDEYYEYSDVTNLLFESGVAVFRGGVWAFEENHNDDFYSLEEIYDIQPAAFKLAMSYFGPDYVGKIGDADKDGEISVMDATAILRHKAKLEIMEVELIGDIDGDNELSVLDATAIQQSLVNGK